MAGAACDRDALGAYAFGALEGQERETVLWHVNTCPQCRAELEELEEVTRMLGELPPEAVLTGPPPGGDLVLQRALRQMRSEVAGAGRKYRVRQSFAVVAAMAACVVAGVALGRASIPAPIPDPRAGAAQPSVVPGTRVLSTVDSKSNARIVATVIPANGWVRLNMAVSGVTRGEKCRIVVISRDGGTEIAASWVVSEKGEAEGTNVDGAAAVPLDRVAAVEVHNAAGETLVSLRL